eukprot:Hpha_TRINITY_DN26387_c0_g1::TRINITY_DN26387_c0_g1_i1::g.9358::m.9358
MGPPQPVDTQLSGIALMKQQEHFIRAYFENCFFHRKFEDLPDWLDEDYVAFTPDGAQLSGIVDSETAESGAAGAPLKQLLLKITQKFASGSLPTLARFEVFETTDADREKAQQTPKWERYAEECKSRGDPLLPDVREWLCKCTVVATVGEAEEQYAKLWMVSPVTGKLCYAWPA